MHLLCRLPHFRRLTHRLLFEMYPLRCQLVLVVIQPCQSTMAQWLHITAVRDPAMPLSGVWQVHVRKLKYRL